MKYHFDHVVLQGHVKNKNHYISSTKVPMATKLGRMITYLDSLLPLKSQDPLITWSCEITWQTKLLYIHVVLQSYVTNDHQTWQGGDIPWRAPTHKLISQWRGFVRSRDMLKTLRLCLHSSNGHQVWQGGDLPWLTSTHKFTLKYMLTRGPMTN